MNTTCFDPSSVDARELQKKSSAVSLSDMEMFVFPELAFSLVLANIMSPVLWQWRDDPWFAGIERKSPMARANRLRQYIMDHYAFNLDLETWGLTTQQRELARFAAFVDRDALAQSNALFGYEGDRYYFDIDIRTHFGLDKFTGDTIPYWKTETIEAMTSFQYKEGYTTGAGECVSLATLYAAALFVVVRIPLQDIFVMATPLHSQNFVDLGEGFLCNNRRIVTKSMWFNGTELSAQARRALENERVTLVAHESGTIHLLYPDATIDPAAFARFRDKLTAYLTTPLTPEMLGSFLRQSTSCRACFVLRWPVHGRDHYIPLERVFVYEQSSKYRITDETRAKVMDEIEEAEFTHSHCAKAIVLNDLEDYLRANPVDIHADADLERLRKHFDRGCLDASQTLEKLIRFCHVQPRLPDAATKSFHRTDPALELTPAMTREQITARIAALRDANEFCRMAFYAYRDLATTEPLPFLVAALQRNPVCIEEAGNVTDEDLVARYAALPDESIYPGSGRLAQPDEVCNFHRGDGLECVLALATVLRERHRDTDFTVGCTDGLATLRHGTTTVCSFPTSKIPRDPIWPLAAIPLR